MSAPVVDSYGIRISAEEHEQGALSRPNLRLAVRLFDLHGLLLVENVFPVELVEQLRDTFFERYASYLVDRDHEDALKVGDRRFMVSVELAPPFSDPGLYASPFLLPIMRQFLGPNYVLGSLGAVAALPGAETQHVHSDHPRLFHNDLDFILPPYGITAMVPLIQMDERTGTTMMWVGSHRMPKELAHKGERVLPYPAPGSLVLMDRRLLHGGTANESEAVRPLLYCEYFRPWFRDYRNYGKQEPLVVSPETFAGVPEEHRRLFAHVFPQQNYVVPQAPPAEAADATSPAEPGAAHAKR